MSLAAAAEQGVIDAVSKVPLEDLSSPIVEWSYWYGEDCNPADIPATASESATRAAVLAALLKALRS